MTRTVYSLGALAAAMLMLAGCAGNPEPSTPSGQEALVTQAQSALTQMKQKDPSLEWFLKNAYGYAIFPSIGKGGLIVGGASGRGVVYEQGNLVGYATMQQASVGAQLGGQTFSELVVFQDKAALDRFKQSNTEFAANASAVALKSGAASAASYENGVSVFTMPQGGLMFEASIGGQKFTFEPASAPNPSGASDTSGQ